MSDIAHTTKSTSERSSMFLKSTSRGLLQEIAQARIELIKGLKSQETENGWTDPGSEKSTQALWTTLNVLTALLNSEVSIKHVNQILQWIYSSQHSYASCIGWESDAIPGIASTYVTADAGLLCLLLGEREKLRDILDSLTKMQNTDGGWGVCHGDSLSKTGPTSFIISRLYSKCLGSSWAFHLLDLTSYSEALQWINHAYNDDDGGWPNLSNEPPSNLSATAAAYLALISTEYSLQKHNNIRLPLQKSIIRSALSTIIRFGKDGSWRGPRQEYGILIPGENIPRRHVNAGTGNLFVADAFIKSVSLGYLSYDESIFLMPLLDVLNRVKPYQQVEGKWLVPSDDGGAPNAWNSAFALDVFHDFEKLYLELAAKGIVEKNLVLDFAHQVRIWRFLTVTSFLVILTITILPRIEQLSQIAAWFNNQSPWVQGIVMIFVAIVIEHFGSMLLEFIKQQMSRIKGAEKS